MCWKWSTCTRSVPIDSMIGYLWEPWHHHLSHGSNGIAHLLVEFLDRYRFQHSGPQLRKFELWIFPAIIRVSRDLFPRMGSTTSFFSNSSSLLTNHILWEVISVLVCKWSWDRLTSSDWSGALAQCFSSTPENSTVYLSQVHALIVMLFRVAAKLTSSLFCQVAFQQNSLGCKIMSALRSGSLNITYWTDIKP